MKKELIIVAGANGSGKTTLSKQVMLMRDYDFLN
jgi:predicted ABC-type ATPase